MVGSEEAWNHIRRETTIKAGQKADVTVVIPTIKGREELLNRALMSIRGEDVVFNVQAREDTEGDGPAWVRNWLTQNARSMGSRYVAYLDDDDEFKPGHLTKLVRCADETGADVVYPWFDLMRGNVLRNDMKFLLQDFGPENRIDPFGQPFSAEALRKNNYIPVTALVRISKFVEVGGFPMTNSEAWPHQDCEDWGLWLRMLDAGAKFEHLPERTWTWFHHGRNTSGRPDNAKKIYGTGKTVRESRCCDGCSSAEGGE